MKPYLKPAALTAKPWSVPALCAVYAWQTGLPKGGVIAIVELGGGWHQSDIDAAFTDIPAPLITDVSVDGTQNTPGSDADGEVALDIEVAAIAHRLAA